LAALFCVPVIGYPSLKTLDQARFKVLVIGFVGGFMERLVPDLLEKRNPQGNGGSTASGTPARVG
jgi:hypothetical protein